jgi:hypothetical protein
VSARREVAIRTPPEAVRARYALDVLLSLVGLTARDAAPEERADVAYGDLEGHVRIPAGGQDGWDDFEPAVRRIGGIPVLEVPGANARSNGAIPFDLLYATYACLTAPWERTDPADEVGCPIAAAGFLARHGLLLEPLAHRYAGLLGRELGASAPGEPALVLTHDVDNNFRHLFARKESLRLLRLDFGARRPAAAARRIVGLLRRAARRPVLDPNDRFEDWRAWHGAWRSRPAYFFAASGLFDEDSARQDVPYDVRHPVVQETVRRAGEDGAEIGVHFSLRAASSADRLRAERERLEEIAGVPVQSSRHHWWALGRPAEETWRQHVSAGVALDCSLGFNDRAGFRRGICVPFRPFDTAAGRALDVHVLPTLAMDAAVFDGRAVDEAVAELRALERVVREIRGALVLDWHVHSANPRALPGAADGLRTFVDEALAGGLAPRTPLEELDERRTS